MILLIEDDAISRTSFAETLRGYGYEVLEASDGAEALGLIEEHHSAFQLVITDMVLPGVHGLNLVNKIRQRWPMLPVVMISAHLSKQAGEVILGPQVDFLQKPIRPDALLSCVKRLAPNTHQ
jgi:DNA-binding NtrC family response regulator